MPIAQVGVDLAPMSQLVDLIVGHLGIGIDAGNDSTQGVDGLVKFGRFCELAVFSLFHLLFLH